MCHGKSFVFILLGYSKHLAVAIQDAEPAESLPAELVFYIMNASQTT